MSAPHNAPPPSGPATPSVDTTGIPGLLVVRQVVEHDERGWFKQGFDRDAFVEQGFPPDFVVVGERMSDVGRRGFTRGIHADWVSKYVGLPRGEAFAAFVDLREGASFGRVETVRLTPAVSVFIPWGVGNSYQTLSDGLIYSYLEERRTTDAPAVRLALDDPDLAIAWPIPISEAILLPDDRDQPRLRAVEPVVSR